MDLPKSEYLDDDFMMEQTIKPKRKSIAKKKQAPPIKLGKYSLTSDVVNGKFNIIVIRPLLILF